MQSILTNQQIIDLAPAAGAVNPISEVSERYSFVSTLDAVEILRETGWFPVHAEQSTVRKVERDGYQRHLIRFARKGLAFEGERVDMMLYNSHDRGCAFKLAASVWRQICGNGLMVASEFANFSHGMWALMNWILPVPPYRSPRALAGLPPGWMILKPSR